MPNETLRNAQVAKKDEFYTQLVDIEKELKYYKQHFQGKVVLCNCDDPYESNFFKYFALNFNALGLKKLIATCYNGSPIAGDELPLLFEIEEKEPKKIAYKVEITEVSDYNGDGAINLTDVQYLIQNDKNVLSLLKENGDFRSNECIELLKEADIVVTNPPFSLFREYLAQLVRYEKQFLIIGNQNAITYKEVFPSIQNNLMWLGATGFVTDMVFGVPEGTIVKESDKVKAERLGYVGNYTRLGNSCWYSNVDHGRRHLPLKLMTMNENFKHSKHKDIRGRKDYIHYENYDAIEVPYTDAIPSDFNGIMGVPKSFVDKYCPEQFEIIGIAEGDSGKELGLKPYPPELKKLNPSLRHGQLYYMEDGYPIKPFARILIRKKQ